MFQNPQVSQHALVHQIQPINNYEETIQSEQNDSSPEGQAVVEERSPIVQKEDLQLEAVNWKLKKHILIIIMPLPKE